MNHRRALRTATDIGLTVFLIMIVGVVLWTTDEFLDWNILPDWIDKFAQVIVVVLGILAGFSVVISVMCSFAILAEAAAEKAGMARPVPSGRMRSLVALGIVLVFGGLLGLHKLDQFRAAKRHDAEEQKKLAQQGEAEARLNELMPNIVALFSPEIRQNLVALASEAQDEALARLLNAIRLSTPFDPEVSVMVPAEAPYKYCIITGVPESQRRADDAAARLLKRQFLTDLPTEWEREAVDGLFHGQKLSVPREKHGVFIDRRKPSAWGAAIDNGKVIAVVMLRGSA